MKNSDLKKLISQYKEFKMKQKKKHVDNFKLSEILKEIEHRYFHETGRTLKSDLENFKKIENEFIRIQKTKYGDME